MMVKFIAIALRDIVLLHVIVFHDCVDDSFIVFSVALFQFFESLYITSEDFSTVSICLELVKGLLATNVTIELVQGTADMLDTGKQNVAL